MEYVVRNCVLFVADRRQVSKAVITRSSGNNLRVTPQGFKSLPLRYKPQSFSLCGFDFFLSEELMDKSWFELYSDKVRWDELVNEYLEKGTATGKTPKSHIFDLWEYFKYCLLTENRFFFVHPLLKVIKEKISQHEIVLPSNSTIFRARVDNGKFFENQSRNLLQVNILKELRDKGNFPGKDEIQNLIDRFASRDGYEEYEKQYLSGFEGFNSEESSAPPSDKASAGRCNLPHIPHLYAAKDMHTEVAEVRPYISDVVSIATLSTNRPLKLIDFYYNLGNNDWIEDEFFWAISSEFSFINKGNEKEYFATQYLTMLIKNMGYDGIQFKSSLVFDGINYVIFDKDACTPISSKLYNIPSIKYELSSVSLKATLKDAKGNSIDDPPLPVGIN